LSSYFHNRQKDSEITRAYIRIAVIMMITLIILSIINSLLIVDKNDKGLHPVFYILFVFLSIFVANYDFFNRDRIKIKKEDTLMIQIFTTFLKELELNYTRSRNVISKIFKYYSPEAVEKVFDLCYYGNKDALTAVSNLAHTSNDIKLFVIYTLLDIAAADGLYSIKDSVFINGVRIQLGIHELTFQTILKQYKSKGLIDEAEVIYDHANDANEPELLPIDAFKILGITPNITHEGLKKAYRRLVKQHHPDKYYGQSDEIIQKEEEAFEEIKKAYETIKKHLQF
jgi:DnaJ-domain-containing protein 1